jgi:D-3-phosphoglycerate dehydrogenase
VIQNLKNCRLIASIGIGYDKIDVKAATEHCVMVANVPDTSREEVSDHIMALILNCTRRVVQLDKDVKMGKWKKAIDPDIQKKIWPAMTRLKGQILGLIGFGGVSRSLIPKAKGFGLTVLAHDPFVSSEVFLEFGVEEVKELDHLLSGSEGTRSSIERI